MSEATGQVKAGLHPKHSGKVICRPQRDFRTGGAFDCASRNRCRRMCKSKFYFAGSVIRICTRLATNGMT